MPTMNVPIAWAIILPKLLTAPIWMVLARRTYSWTPDQSVSPAPLSSFRSFGPAILVSEILGAARLHADKLIVGAFLGTEALGLYYFAFNAGLGITQSLVAACNLVLFPHLSKLSGLEFEREFCRAFVGGLALFAPLVATQALLAPFYVPIVFGDKWVDATLYLALLACAALHFFTTSLPLALMMTTEKALTPVTSLIDAISSASARILMLLSLFSVTRPR